MFKGKYKKQNNKTLTNKILLQSWLVKLIKEDLQKFNYVDYER